MTPDPIRQPTTEESEFAEALGSHLEHIQTIRDQHGTAALAIDQATKLLRGAPRKHIRADDLASWFDDEDLAQIFQAAPIVREVAANCVEFSGEALDVEGSEQGSGIAPLRDRIEVVFRLSKWTRQGRVVLGSAGPVGAKQRDLDPEGPLWTVTLSLPYWLLADEHERRRLVHHELMHLKFSEGKPKGRGHDLEEFVATVARFGLMGREDVALVAHAIARPDTAPLLRSYDYGEDGQGLLFPLTYAPVDASVLDFPALSKVVPADGVALLDEIAALIPQVVGLPEECELAAEWSNALHDLQDRLLDGGDATNADEARVRGIAKAVGEWA